MTRFTRTLCAAAMLVSLLSVPAFACSWAAFFNGDAAVIARTVDWYSNDNAVIKGYGRGRVVRAADTANALEYTSKYASLQVHSFASQVVVDALNEKGLHGAILYLDESRLPASEPGRKDVNPNSFLPYAVSSFATVRELVDSLGGLNFLPALLDIPGSDGGDLDVDADKWPGHFAFADTTGDKAIIEFIKGEVVVYHGGEYDAVANDPRYEIIQSLQDLGYTATGSIQSPDRLFRAKDYLRDMHERDVKTTSRAILAMRGLLATLTSGSEMINRKENELYPTIWGAVVDQNAKRYYFSRIYSWCAEVYDFSMFDTGKPEVTPLKNPDCPLGEIDVTGVL